MKTISNHETPAFSSLAVIEDEIVINYNNIKYTDRV